MQSLTLDRTSLSRLTGPSAFERGQRYLAEGEVRHLRHSAGKSTWQLTGTVLERPVAVPNQVTLSHHGRFMLGLCSCRSRVNCAHVAALGLAYLNEQAVEPPAPPAPSWRSRLSEWSASPAPRSPATPLSYRVWIGPSAHDDRPRLWVQLGRVEADGFRPMAWSALSPASPDPVNRLLAADLQHLRANAYRWRLNDTQLYGDQAIPLPDELVDGWLRSLSVAKRVVDRFGEPLQIRPAEPLRFALHFARDAEGGATLTPSLSGPAGPIDAGDLQRVGAPLTWGLLGDSLHPLEGSAPASSPQDPIALSAADVPDFERIFLPRLAIAGKLAGPDAPLHPTVSNGEPRPQLLLEEHKGKLIGRVGYLYGGIRTETGDYGELVGPASGPWLRRDLQAEKELRAELKRMVPRANGGRLSLSGDAALDFLCEKLEGIFEAGWEVLGADTLSLFQLSRSSATARYTLESGIDWFDLEARVEVDGESVPWQELVNALSEKRRYVRLGSGRYAQLPRDWLQSQRPMLAALGLDLQRLGGKVRVPRHQAPMLDRLLEGADSVEADESWRDFIRKLKTFGGIAEVDVPEGFRGELRPYQRQGLNFLKFLGDYGLHGILADDMGLGKTVQASAYLLYRQGAGPSLVVAPTSLMANWQAELARFAPQLRVLVLHGPGRDRAAIERHDVVLTTYATARLDLETHRKVTYDTLILDEAQAIKNPASQTAVAMRSLKARHRLCLTGTPIENHLMELWSQFAFLMPGMLGSERDFKARYAQSVAMGDKAAAEELKRRVSPFILRRLKGEVAKDLPPRSDFVVWCDLDPAQRMAYEAVMAASRDRVLAAVGDKGLERSQITILDALLKLRQVCCHPRLLKAAETMHLPSAKLEGFMDLVSELVEGGHRALVFSQFTSMLAILRERLDAAGIAYEYLDGRTRDRQARVERFNGGETPLFLISLKAGGTGLNLTGADYVIHFDPWWNPAVEDQATDRAHRIGQTRQVFNYKLIAKGTVEEKLLVLQDRKRGLVRDVLEADALGKRLTLDDLQFLFEA